MNNDEKILQIKRIIKNTEIDTHYILDKEKPQENIRAVLFVWSVSLLVYGLFWILYYKLSFALNFVNCSNYVQITIILQILLPFFPLCAYFIKLNLIEKISLKEKRFITIFSIIPIIICLYKVVSPVLLLINVDYLNLLQFAIPLDYITCLVGVYLIYLYTKNISFIYYLSFLVSFFILCIGLNMFFSTVVEVNHFVNMLLLVNMFVTELNDFLISAALTFLVSLNFMDIEKIRGGKL